MRANQLRLWFASMAYVLMSALRRRALATCGTIRAKLLKIGALVTVSVRRGLRLPLRRRLPPRAPPIMRLTRRRPAPSARRMTGPRGMFRARNIPRRAPAS